MILRGEVAEFVGDIWFAEGNVLGGRDLIAATGFKEAALPIASGDCVLHRQANFAGAFFAEIDATLGPDGDVNVFYLPTISDEFGQVVLGAGTHAVAFTDKPETMAVLEYIGSAEYADTRIKADKGGFLSPNRDHDTSLYSSDFDRTLAEILVSASPFRFDASDLIPARSAQASSGAREPTTCRAPRPPRSSPTTCRTPGRPDAYPAKGTINPHGVWGR